MQYHYNQATSFITNYLHPYSTNYTTTLSNIADDAIRNAILTPLVEYNERQTGHNNHQPLVISIQDENGSVIGGLWGSTAWGWLYVQLLVVPDHLRGSGVGRDLMMQAEQEAMRRDCQGAWLDTFEFQARGFYERLGYQCFGDLPNYPAGFSRYFMKKTFALS